MPVTAHSVPVNVKNPARPSLSGILGSILVLAWASVPFIAAGTWRWQAGWIYLGVLVAGLLAHRSYVGRRNPGLRLRRKEIGTGTKSWDKLWNAVFWPLMVVIPVVAGLDGVRFTWSRMPVWFILFGAASYGCGMLISARAMAQNPFFEGTVRIQHDRGQYVVTEGPYRKVRHPGYVGLILWALATPFLLISWWALVPAAITAAWVVMRTALEDRTLRYELGGYAAYAARVRFRLVPGVW